MNDELIEKAARAGYEAMLAKLEKLHTAAHTWDGRFLEWDNQNEILKEDWLATAKVMLAVFQEDAENPVG